MYSPDESSSLVTPNVFGVYRYFLKFSPFYCGRGNPLRFLFVLFSLATFLSMLFRIYWMWWQVSAELLSFGWAERNLYAFISFESFSCVIGLYRMTTMGSLRKLEEKIAQLKTLRINPINHVHDDYTGVWRKMFFLCAPIPVCFMLTSSYLVYHKTIIYDSTSTNTWYFYIDAAIMFLCGYVNFLFLPIHVCVHSGIRRELSVFNEELQKAAENKELTNNQIFTKFGDRQVALFEYTNTMTERLDALMTNAPFLMLTGLANVTFLVTFLNSKCSLLYFFCLLSLMICSIIICSNLMYPAAFIQEEMQRTARILMSDPLLQHSTDPQTYSTYRMIVDRSLHNRSVNNVIHIFSVSRKNIERAFFFITQVVLVMSCLYNLLYPDHRA